MVSYSADVINSDGVGAQELICLLNDEIQEELGARM